METGFERFSLRRELVEDKAKVGWWTAIIEETSEGTALWVSNRFVNRQPVQ